MPAPTDVEHSDSVNPSSPQERIFRPVMSSLGWPILTGMTAFWIFLMVLEEGWIQSELLTRYLSAHPVSYVATAMFFVGLAGLGIKLLDVALQITDKSNIKLSPAPALAQRPEESRHLLHELEEFSSARQNSCYGKRLRSALQFVDKTESANGLEDELKYLADLDAETQQESFALTRILIWAIPMLGFLGTVIGISGALGGLSVESDFNTMLTGLKEKLYVAFDTTALALTLSIVLMFAQFIVNRVETQLLAAVDASATEELSGRFLTFGSNRDPYLASVENMSQRVLDCMTDIGSQQAETWNHALEAVKENLASSLGSFAEILAERLTSQLDPVMDEFGHALRSAISDSTNHLDLHSNKLTEAMGHSVELIDQRNREMMRGLEVQSSAIKDAVDTHAASLNQYFAGSEDAVQQQLVQVHQQLEETCQLVHQQYQQLEEGIGNSKELIEANSESVKQVVQAANLYIQHHLAQLNEVIAASSQAVEDHSRRFSDVITRSDEVVDRRQEVISRTQESMLIAQNQQSMAISNFTEKLEAMQELVEQSKSLEQIQSTMNETLSSLERSDSIAHEIHGLASLVKEQVKSIDRNQLVQAEANDKQWSALIHQLQMVIEQNSRTSEFYWQKMDGLIELLSRGQQGQKTESVNEFDTPDTPKRVA